MLGWGMYPTCLSWSTAPTPTVGGVFPTGSQMCGPTTLALGPSASCPRSWLPEVALTGPVGQAPSQPPGGQGRGP